MHGDVKLGSVGRPYEGVEVRIVGDDRRDVGPDEPGAVWVRSPFGDAGLLVRPVRERDRSDDGGFLHIGDSGTSIATGSCGSLRPIVDLRRRTERRPVRVALLGEGGRALLLVGVAPHVDEVLGPVPCRRR